MHSPLYKKHIFVKPCIKQHALLVDPLGVSYDFFAHSDFDVFFDSPKRGAQTKKRARKSGSRIENSISQTSQRGQFRPKRRGPKGCHSEFRETERAQGEPATQKCLGLHNLEAKLLFFVVSARQLLRAQTDENGVNPDDAVWQSQS